MEADILLMHAHDANLVQITDSSVVRGVHLRDVVVVSKHWTVQMMVLVALIDGVVCYSTSVWHRQQQQQQQQQ